MQRYSSDGTRKVFTIPANTLLYGKVYLYLAFDPGAYMADGIVDYGFITNSSSGVKILPIIQSGKLTYTDLVFDYGDNFKTHNRQLIITEFSYFTS